MPIKPSTRPESYSQLVARSLKLYWQALPRTFFFAFLTAIVVFIPRLICVAVGQNVFLKATGSKQILVLYLAIYVSVLWFAAAIIWCINCIERNKHKNFITDIEMAGKRIIYVLGAAVCLFIIASLIGGLGYFLHCLLWHLKLYSLHNDLTVLLFFLVLLLQLGASIFVSTLFYFYFPLIVIEHDGIATALKQSALLVWHKVWMTLGVQLTPWLAYLVTLIAVKMIFKLNIIIYFMPINPVANFYPVLLHIGILALFIPWASSIMLVQLRDLELRKAAASRKKK